MKFHNILYLLMFPLLLLAAEQNTCRDCHLANEDEANQPAHLFQNDVHFQVGLTCASCHGGDPTSEDPDIAMSPARGFKGAPSVREIPKLCASCHSDESYMKQFNPNIQTDQYQQYLTSRHGKLWQTGDKKVATCISCHSVHDIRKVKDFNSPVFDANVPKTCATCHSNKEYMAPYGIPTDQYDEYVHSVHGKMLLEKGDRGAPACNDCHGNHGATPPGVNSISMVCGTCHVLNMELYQKSPKKAIFEDMGEPGCETCHGNHGIQKTSDAMLGVQEGAVCADCHQDEEEESFQKVKRMRQLIDDLREHIQETDSLLTRAEHAGMEVSDAQFEFRDVQNSLVKARGMIHAFDPDLLRGEVEVGLKKNEKVRKYAVSALGEIRYRRTGLLVALVFILLLIIGLYFKIKEVDRKHGVR